MAETKFSYQLWHSSI